MINDRLIWHLEHNNILTDIQCGFRKRKSTVDHLVRLESFIRDAFLNKQEVVSIFLTSRRLMTQPGSMVFLKIYLKRDYEGECPFLSLNFLKIVILEFVLVPLFPIIFVRKRTLLCFIASDRSRWPTPRW